MNVRLRFKDPDRPIRYVRGRDLRPSPLNWRTHPPFQADALRGVLSEVGIAAAALARELPDGTLELIDGHLRAETLPDQEIPVLVLDVTEAEAKLLLATFDRIGALAGTDLSRADALMQQVETNNPALARMLEEAMADQAEEAAGPAGEDEIPERYQILVTCATEGEQAEWLEKLTAAGLGVRSLMS